MDGLCCGGLPAKTLDEGCAITKRTFRGDRDPHRLRVVKVATFCDMPGKIVVHCNCGENQLRGLEGRVLGPVPHPTEEGLVELRAAALRMSVLIPKTVELPFEHMMEGYSGAKKALYLAALHVFERAGILKRDARVTAFVKKEKMDAMAKHDPDPRMIQFRDPVFCVAVAAYLRPVEEYLYRISGWSKGVPPSRNVAKGLNSNQRAAVLVEKLKYFSAPAVLSLDASRFDKHVSLELLQIEHSIYLASNPNPFFRQLLSWQLVNKGRTDLGIKYVARGRRMSGDMNTAIGNCIIMLLMIEAFCRAEDVRKWDCLDDGDDVLLIVESAETSRLVPRVVPHFTRYGMTMKVESVETDLHTMEFCQSRLVEVDYGYYKFVRNPFAVIQKSTIGCRHWENPKYVLSVLCGTGTGELIINLGVPVLQSFALMLIRITGGSYDLSRARDGLRRRAIKDLKLLGMELVELAPRPVQPCARITFEKAWGVSVSQQLFLEQQFDAMSFSVGEPEHIGSELIKDWCFQFEEHSLRRWQNVQ